ncbi:RNA polymerase sigma-70 factor [Prevotella sp. DNF00663]|uniref:RNA polymerase sigma-70 factor n=1 Tax=unclassified Prevotella TaxID=2638335 RepID=UPI0005145141|nr:MULTISPECIES: RNA polymerase sigma-70 factor [unclassified Prevotella]KGI61299.1 RNA polymerase subunit sigma-70 [Prevotella sp. S7 MS 2]KXB79476.1 RNA polymerase sigma-70 factor [Prevotella sp. DNF00663]
MDITLTFQYYYRPLCLYAIHYLHDIDAAEDVVQECFAKLWERKKDRPVDNVKAFLYTSVRNMCIDNIRKANPIDGNVLPSDLEGTLTDGEAEERSFHEAELWTAIDKLPTRCREVFVMSKRDNMKYREIASELGISEKTVEHQVSKALKILRGKVESFFYMLGLCA